MSGETRGLAPAIGRGVLWVASVPYGWATRLRNGLYDGGWARPYRADVPVVSIGNLTLGGTGKTPCVDYVARFYQRLGRRPAVLSRGYGGRGGPNDEALVLRENLPGVPHFLGADRVRSARRAVRERAADVLVLDDGFQHRRLARDLDVLLVDATQPWGYGRLFPRGLLREARRGVRRSGVVVITRADQASAEARARLRRCVGRLAPGVPVAESVHRPVDLVGAGGRTAPVATLAGARVAGFCGVGNPSGFRTTLQQLGAQVTDFRAYPDHNRYDEHDLQDLNAWANDQATDCVVTTQKDLVKLPCPALGDKPLWAVRIRLEPVAGGEALDRKLKEALR